MILLLYLSSTVGKPGHAIQHSQTSVLHSLPQTQQIICFRAGSVSRNNFNQYNSKMGKLRPREESNLPGRSHSNGSHHKSNAV